MSHPFFFLISLNLSLLLFSFHVLFLSLYQRTVPSLAALSISYSCLSFFITFPFPLVSIPFFSSLFHFSFFPFLFVTFSFPLVYIHFFSFRSHSNHRWYLFFHFPTSFHPLSCFNSYFPLSRSALTSSCLVLLIFVNVLFLISLFPSLSPSSLSSLSIIFSSLPLSQFLIHYFLISPSL